MNPGGRWITEFEVALIYTENPEQPELQNGDPVSIKTNKQMNKNSRDMEISVNCSSARATFYLSQKQNKSKNKGKNTKGAESGGETIIN